MSSIDNNESLALLKSKLATLGDNIRTLTGSADKLYIDDMISKTQNIEIGTNPTGTLSITENGTHDVSAYESAEVNVTGSGSSKKTVTVTVTGNYYNYARYIDENGVIIKITSNGQTVEALNGIVLSAAPEYDLVLDAGEAFIYNGYFDGGFAICTKDGAIINLYKNTSSGGSVV